MLVELRDPVPGRVVESRRLQLGTDHRIDDLQGLVILTEPLPPSARDAGLVTDDPTGDYDLNLVVQYEYVPLGGSVDGLVAGGRVEAWATPALRFGLSGATDDDGLPETRLVGADALLRRAEGTWLSLDGGLTIEDRPTAGLDGEPADSLRVEGRADLAEVGLGGYVAGYFDRKDAGFSSPDQDVEVAQQVWGLEGEVALAPALALTFGLDRFEDDEGERRDDERVGLALALSQALLLEAEVAASSATACPSARVAAATSRRGWATPTARSPTTASTPS